MLVFLFFSTTYLTAESISGDSFMLLGAENCEQPYFLYLTPIPLELTLVTSVKIPQPLIEYLYVTVCA